MAQITLEYDARNNTLKKALDLIVSLGAKVVTPKKEKKLTDIEISMQEARDGKINTYKSSNDLFKKLGI
ncbi:MAG: hypothetical protein J6U79_01490 [Paludibacteraceae bacterium]|nr:hypothetical protein [Paludibacteraceae bacterium]